MKKIFYLFTMVISLVLTGCASDDPSTPISSGESTSVNPYRVSVNDAVQIANKMLADIGDVKTRSNRQVESVSAITSNVLTRSSQEANDTVLYIINYANDEGFAIVAADKRAIPVYAISDSGHFQITKESNPAIETMLSYATESAKYNIQSSDFIPAPFDSIGPNPNSPIEWNEIPPHKKIAPMLSKRQNRIGPYDKNLNKYVVNDKGEPALTCCGPIAIELIMSYYKWPVKLENHKFDWDTMNSGDNDDDIAQLLAILSRKEYAYVRGNDLEKIGSIKTDSVQPTFKKCGYIEPDSFINFYQNEDKAISDLDNGPLFLSGGPGSSEFSTGHVWAVDGLLQYLIYDGTTTTTESGILIRNVKTYTYYHCVWGDTGKCNGYYLVADHDFNGKPDIIDPIDSGDMSSAKYRDYSKNIRFISNFKPDKALIPTFPPIPYQPQ